jgi:hypothetical protein
MSRSLDLTTSDSINKAVALTLYQGKILQLNNDPTLIAISVIKAGKYGAEPLRFIEKFNSR